MHVENIDQPVFKGGRSGGLAEILPFGIVWLALEIAFAAASGDLLPGIVFGGAFFAVFLLLGLLAASRPLRLVIQEDGLRVYRHGKIELSARLCDIEVDGGDVVVEGGPRLRMGFDANTRKRFVDQLRKKGLPAPNQRIESAAAGDFEGREE